LRTPNFECGLLMFAGLSSSTILCLQVCLSLCFIPQFSVPWMRKAGGGSIVNMVSVSSHIAQPAFVPYNTSKGAIMQLVRRFFCTLGTC